MMLYAQIQFKHIVIVTLSNNILLMDNSDILTEAVIITDLLATKRASYYHTWLQVGVCLHNIDDTLLSTWIKFSKRCPDMFHKGHCEKKWQKMTTSNYAMSTLHFFAAIDNPIKYQEYKHAKLNEMILDNLKTGTYTIADIVMHKYKFRFKYCRKSWYEFSNHRWIYMDNAYVLRNLISDELTLDYAALKESLIQQQKHENDIVIRSQLTYQTDELTKITKKLNSYDFKSTIINKCAAIVADPDFVDKANENPYLICFENGVYDLQLGIMRAGYPDDNITYSTNYEYISYEPDDEDTADIEHFFGKIQENDKLRAYLITLLATCLEGSISDNNFYIFTGSFTKNILMDLMEQTFGDYYRKVDYNEKKKALTGVRCCRITNTSSVININILEHALCKPFLVGELPNSINTDDAVDAIKRVKVIEFTSYDEEYFWNIRDEFPEWRQMFMSMLLFHYQQYRTLGLIHPETVTPLSYRKSSNVYQEFIDNYLTFDNHGSVTIEELHRGMRKWYRNNCNGKCPNMKTLREFVRTTIPTFDRRHDVVKGYAMIKN